MKYSEIIERIRRGDLPALTGTQLNKEEIDVIKELLEIKKRDFCYNVDNYYNNVIATRLRYKEPVIGIDFAKPGGDQTIRSTWRFTEDKELYCYAIQRRRRFLFWTWWTNEYMTTDKQTAEALVKYKSCR